MPQSVRVRLEATCAQLQERHAQARAASTAPVEWQELSNERAAYEELNRKLKQQGLLLTGHQRLGTPTFVGLVIGG